MPRDMHQSHDDFTNAFSPVSHFSGLYMFQSIATTQCWKHMLVDLTQRFIQTDLYHESPHVDAVTQGLQKLFKDTQWTVDPLSCVVGHKSVSASVCHDLLLKFSIRKEDRVKVIKNLGRTLLDELENLFRSYWGQGPPVY